MNEPANLHEALHALRGELGVVRGNAELLQSAPDAFSAPEREALLSEIARAAERMDELSLSIPGLVGEQP